MNELGLFAGGCCGFQLGFKRAFKRHGLPFKTVCYVEIDKACQRNIMGLIGAGELSDAPIWDDIRTFNGKPWCGKVDIVTGGFPCQPYSGASRGRKTATDLWPEMYRVVREVRPAFVLAENVQRKPMLKAAYQLTQIGYSVFEPFTISAADVGADHIRRRYWLFGYADHKRKPVLSINDETSWLPKLQKGIWQSDPTELRVANGISGRVDRLRMIGNAVVPQVVEYIAECLISSGMLQWKSN